MTAFPCFAHCGDPACELHGCIRVYNDRNRAIGSSGRVLNLDARRAGVPELILCPRCDGQAFDQGSCGLCGNCGYLKSEGAERLDHAEMVQILATFALATGIELEAPRG